MKFKYTAIALAVAGSTAAPVAVQAGADEIYASARIGYVSRDAGGANNAEIQGIGSRFGMKGETDLGNGMTGFGKYEWSVGVDGADVEGNGTNAANIGLRHGIVGLKGDFGSVTLGRTYHTFYNHVVGPNDNPWWGSGYAMVAYVGRTSNAISYAGSAGAISFGATAYMIADAEEDATDGFEFGATFGIGDMNLGVAVRDMEAAADAVTGLALTGIPAGDVSLGIGFQSRDKDSSFLIDAGFANAYIHFETMDNDAANTSPTMFVLGYTQSLGRKTTAWYEFQSTDADTGVSNDDVTVLRAILKYDII